MSIAVKDWDENGHINCHHTVYGYDDDAPNYNAHYKEMEKFTYSEESVKNLLSELTLCELADITPDIQHVKYTHIIL